MILWKQEVESYDFNFRKVSSVPVSRSFSGVSIPTAISCAASTTCLIAGLTVGAKRNAAIAAAYKLSETALTNYKESVVETIGSEKEKDVRSKVAEKSVASNPVKNIFTTINKSTCLFLTLSDKSL